MRPFVDQLGPIRNVPGFNTAEEWIRATGVQPLVTSAAWASANLAVYMPIILTEESPLNYLAIYNGAAVSGNFDIGIYSADSEGKPATRIMSTGSQAQSGTTQWQMYGVAAKTLARGLYYLAVVLDNAVGQVMRVAALTTDGKGPWMASVFTQAAAFPLPASATPSASGVATPMPYAFVGSL